MGVGQARPFEQTAKAELLRCLLTWMGDMPHASEGHCDPFP